MEIPLPASLHPSPRACGIQIRRWIDRKQELAEFSFTAEEAAERRQPYGHLTGSGPFLTAARRDLRTALRRRTTRRRQGDPFQDGSEKVGSVGADLKYGLTSNSRLDATVNLISGRSRWTRPW